MKLFHISTALLFLFTTLPSAAQLSFGGRPMSFEMAASLEPAPLITLPAVDVAALMAEDEARIASGIKGPWRFGFNHMVDLDLDNSGIWHELANGDRLWRLSVGSPGAISINFEFHDYVVPPGARVFVFNDEGEHLGAFTAESNPGGQVLGVGQIAGERITIEYIEPAAVLGQGRLRVGQITHAYRDMVGKMRGLGDSGSCNRNVICPEGDEWRDQIRSVGIIVVGGSSACTGTLINNCENDGTPYFLTANHCLFGSTSTWVFRFNWDSPVCNASQNGPTGQTVSGSSIKVSSAPTDVALLELNTPPPASYNVFYSGWDRSSTPAQNATAIHHPSGDVKKISRENQPLVAEPLFGTQPNFWKVAGWDLGTTEGGSSGSGLWNQHGLLVGQLWGGEASCSFNFNDFYGRFDLSYPLLQTYLGNCGTQLQGYPESVTSIAGRDATQNLSIYPNPAVDRALIQLPEQAAGMLQLRMHDATGRMVFSTDLASGAGRFDLDLSPFADGIYLVKLSGDGSQAAERLVITR